MAGGKRTRRVHQRDDGTFEVAGALATDRSAGGNVHEHLTSLQRSYGNQAVTTLVQRKGGGRRRPPRQASRDVPGKAAPKVPDFFPKDDVSASLAARDIAWLEYVAPLEYKNGSRAKAAKLYEELVYKKRRDINEVKKYAAILHMAYGSTDPERSLYWMKVAKGEIRPEETKTIAELLQEMKAAETAAQSD
jgi:hypothetical protein